MKIDGDWITFSTGKTRYAHGGIVGLGDDLEVTHGWDGSVWQPEESEYMEDPLTADELRELADYMIALWTGWRNAVTPEKQL